MACSPTGQTGTETDSGASSGGGESSTSDNPTTGATSSGQVCVPGMSVACACPDGTMSAQVCNPDGKGYGMCSCDGGTGTASDSATTGSMTSGPVTTDAMTSGPMTTGPMTTGPMTTGPDTTGGSTGGGGCVDSGMEPNEDEMSAVDLGEQACDADPQTFMGVLDGDTDVDWYTYHGAWIDQCGMIDPTAMQTVTASDAVRVCVFADCDNSNAAFMCGQAMMAQSPNGVAGCCAMGSVSYVVNCQMNPNESAQIYVRLDQAPADSCVDYTVEYSYQPA